MKTNKKQKNIPEGWEFKEVAELLDYEQPQTYLVSSTEYQNEYKTPVLTAGKSFILGYTNETDGIYPANDLPVIIFDDFTTAHKFVDFPFKAKSSAMKILKAKNGANIKFVYGWMNIHPYTLGEHKRNYLSEYQYQDVLTPPLSEQNRIVGVLEAWDTGIEKLKQKIEIKKQIKKGLMQQLLTGKKRLPGFSGEWDRLELSKTVSISTGKKDVNEGNPGGQYPFFTCAREITYSDDYSYDTEAILIAGNADVGHCKYYKGKFEAYQRTYILSNFEKQVVPTYLFLYMSFFFKSHVESLKQIGAMSYIKLPMLRNFEIKLPGLKEQKAIAEILTAADDEIAVLEQKLSLWHNQKKYLLNNLVTGQIRTPKDMVINKT